MSAWAAVMTGPGVGAIATIELHGESAARALDGVFQSSVGGALESKPGDVFLGHIVGGDETIDQVAVGCEAPDVFAIHCHGNPLIVERVMDLLQRHGVELVDPEQLLVRTLTDRGSGNAIAREAKLAMSTVKTIEGARLIAHQVEGGLGEKVRQWQQRLAAGEWESIRAEAAQILRDSEPARLVISGCTIALVGPPNTGKSTLLNALAGREKALVTDVEGTTRDWVSAEIHIPPLLATVIDTAGLDADLAEAAEGALDQAAQAGSIEIVGQADVVLLVLDAGRPASQLDTGLVDRLTGKRIVTVLNKSDLPVQFDAAHLPKPLPSPLRISAKHETGLQGLIETIRQICHLADFSTRTAAVFTARQSVLIQQMASAPGASQMGSCLGELLQGCVGGFQSLGVGKRPGEPL